MEFYDMHVHSQSSHDSVAPVKETAEACLNKGVSAFAVTDHCDIQYFDPKIVESSVTEANETAQAYQGKVKVLVGIEIGEAIWDKSTAEKILSKYDYDVVISSVHAVRYGEYTDPYSTIDFSKMDINDLNAYVKTYFDEVLIMLKEIDFDVLAHFTCPFRYIVGKYRLDVDVRRYEEQIDKILDCVVEKGISLEINTSGVDTPFDTLMPEEWIVKRYRQKGGRYVTLGSDAHVSQNAAKGFDKAVSMLKSLGFDSYCYYEKRQKQFCKI